MAVVYKITTKKEVTSRIAFALNLRESRVATGLSQRALSRLAGVDQAYVSYLERARRGPSFGALIALAEALGVEPSFLFREPTIMRGSRVIEERDDE